MKRECCNNLVLERQLQGMAAKKTKGRLDLLEEKMVEVQGELQREMGSIRNDLQRLGPWKKIWEYC